MSDDAYTVALVPSRGRPAELARLVEAVTDTTSGRVDVHVGLDDDDTCLPDYMRTCRKAFRSASVFYVRPRKSLTRWTNQLASWAMYGGRWNPRYLVSLGDDHLPRTQDWDLTLAAAITDLDGPGWAYGDDLFQHERLPTAWMQSAELAHALGWVMMPGCDHMFVDNVVAELGRATGRLAYRPDVVIEHLHPAAGKAEMDDSYRATNHPSQYAADGHAFQLWKQAGLPEASRIVKALQH